MKEFLKKHWKGLVCGAAAAVLIAGVIFLYCQGFRITYAPELDNNWDAVSAVAAWVSILVSIAAVIASIVAIVYAIRVPKEIADRQDKIALFEKRLPIYLEIQSLYAFTSMIKMDIDKGKKDLHLMQTFGAVYSYPFHTHEEGVQFVHSIIATIKQIPLLFPEVTQKDYDKLADSFIKLYCENTFQSTYDKKVVEQTTSDILGFCYKYNKIFKQYLVVVND